MNLMNKSNPVKVPAFKVPAFTKFLNFVPHNFLKPDIQKNNKAET